MRTVNRLADGVLNKLLRRSTAFADECSTQWRCGTDDTCYEGGPWMGQVRIVCRLAGPGPWRGDGSCCTP